VATGGHAADEDAWIGVMGLHANAVSKNCSPCIGAGGIDRDDSHRALLLAVVAGKLVHQRALPGSRSTGQANDPRFAAERKERFQQCHRFWSVIFNHADGTSQSPDLSSPYTLDPILDGFSSQH